MPLLDVDIKFDHADYGQAGYFKLYRILGERGKGVRKKTFLQFQRSGASSGLRTRVIVNASP